MKIRSCSARRDPRAPGRRRASAAAAAGPRPHGDRPVSAVAQRVLDAGSRRRAAAASRRRGSAAARGRSPAAPARRPADVLHRGAHDLVQRAPVLARLGAARPAAARGRAAGRRAAPAAGSRWRSPRPSSSCSSASSAGDAERLGGGEDRRQRRAQVVRYRPQHRGLDLVAAPQRAGLHHLARQRLALERRREQRLERRHDPLARDARRRSGHDQPAERSPRDAARSPRTADPLDRGRSSTTAAESTPSASAIRFAAAGSVLERLRRPSSRRASSAASSAWRRRRSASRARERAQLRQRRHDRGRDHEDQQRDPILGVGDRQLARRRDMEEVEGQRRGEAGGDAQPQAPHARDEQHGEQIQRRRARPRVRRRRTGTAATSSARARRARRAAPRSKRGARPGDHDARSLERPGVCVLACARRRQSSRS